MFFKVLTISVATVFAVHQGLQRRRRRKYQTQSQTVPKILKKERGLTRSSKELPRNLEDEWFCVTVVLLLCISALLGTIMFLDSLTNQNDILQISTIGTLLLITLVIILSSDILTTGQLSDNVETDDSTVDVVDLSGDWTKNHEESTSIDPVFDLMKIGPLLKTAVRLVHGIKIEQKQGNFHLTVVSVIKFLKITEVYSMTGEASQWKRRDLRRGRLSGFVQSKPGTQSLMLNLEWNDPLAGKGTDEFILLSPSKLLVRSTLYLDGQVASYDTIYNKEEK
eukprot:g7866.t1